MNDKTVMVVSNNNPATDNVFEKLNKYGYPNTVRFVLIAWKSVVCILLPKKRNTPK